MLLSKLNSVGAIFISWPEAADVIHGIARRESVAKGPTEEREREREREGRQTLLPRRPSFRLPLSSPQKHAPSSSSAALRYTTGYARYMHAACSPCRYLSRQRFPHSLSSSCHTLSRSHRVDKLQRSELLLARRRYNTLGYLRVPGLRLQFCGERGCGGEGGWKRGSECRVVIRLLCFEICIYIYIYIYMYVYFVSSRFLLKILLK